MICDTPDQASVQREMIADLMRYRYEPLRAIKYGFKWGEGELANETGPRAWQRRQLEELGAHLRNPETRYKPFRKANSSGHGIGKSAFISWIIWWGLSTFEDCKVIVMAGTGDQLKTKTQPEVAKWFRMAINAAWFEVNVTSIKVLEPGHETNWRCDFNTWSEENPQASAGAHNKDKRLIIIYDEASGIHNEIWKTQQGALTDDNTEIIWIACSQCTRKDGAFYDAVFGVERHRWNPEVIDSREVEGINLEEINQTVELYGEESDHVRVRYRGLYPVVGEGSFIHQELINQAQERTGAALFDEPLIAGVDFAWGGADENVIRFRKGFDAKTIKPIRIRGELTRDPAVMAGRIVDVLNTTYNGQKVDMLFADGSGVGGNAGAVMARVRMLGFTNVMEVNFGHDALDNQHYVLRRDEMWGKMKDWLRDGGAIDNDPGLAADLSKPILMGDKKQRIKLEPKDVMKRRLSKMGIDSASPDDADALALTFAMPVSLPQKPKAHVSGWAAPSGDGGWMA